MNSEKSPSPMKEGFVHASAWSTQQPPGEMILNWLQVIYQAERDSEERDFREAWSDATYAKTPRTV